MPLMLLHMTVRCCFHFYYITDADSCNYLLLLLLLDTHTDIVENACHLMYSLTEAKNLDFSYCISPDIPAYLIGEILLTLQQLLLQRLLFCLLLRY